MSKDAGLTHTPITRPDSWSDDDPPNFWLCANGHRFLGVYDTPCPDCGGKPVKMDEEKA
jgi:hypothetical protein